jgi:hypothetical protein
MFFGKVLNQGQNFKFSASEVEETQGEVLSITNVVLAPTSKENASLYVNKDGQEYLIATLTKERPQATINLFISLLDDVSLLVKGNGSLHITGFFEPDQDGDLPLEDDEDEEDEEEESEEEEVPVKKPAQVAAKPAAQTKPQSPQQKPQSPQQKPQTQPAKPAQQEKKPAVAPAKPAEVEDEDDDDEDEDLDE